MTQPPDSLIICAPSMGFPEGFAATARVHQYAKVLASLGEPVTVICPAPSERDAASARNVAPRGSIEGTSWWYPGGNTVRSASFVVRRWRAIKSWALIAAEILRRRPRTILLYPMTPTTALLVLPAARLAGSALLCDQSELPEVHAGRGMLRSMRVRWKEFGMRRADGIIAISTSIAERIHDWLPEGRVIVVPVMIDARDYPRRASRPAAIQRRVLYAGPFNDRKDGVGTLIEAFALLGPEHAEARLVLAGENDPAVIERYRSRAEALGVASRCEFPGSLERPALLAAMAGADALALPRPDSEQNRANMPTKLVEYLATGTPVVATDVGHVREILEDPDNAVLVPPGDPTALAEGLASVLADTASAEGMGDRARRSILERLDYTAHVEAIGVLVDAGRG